MVYKTIGKKPSDEVTTLGAVIQNRKEQLHNETFLGWSSMQDLASWREDN